MGIRELLRRRNVTVHLNVPHAADVLGMDAAQLYRTQPALRAVVSFLADNSAHLPLHCYVRESDNSRRRDTTSDLAKLFARPNADSTEHELMRDSASDYWLYGWFIWLVLPDADSDSGWTVTHIPTAWFDEWPTLDGLSPVEYTFTNPETAKRVTVPASDCIRFYGYGPEGPMHPGSAIESLKQVLSEQISAWNYRNSVWKNGGRVSAYLTRPMNAPDWASTGARSRFIESWKQRYSGDDGDNTGGTPLLEDGMELKTTQFNAREAQWMEATKLSREDVAAVYHVNPSLIWHTDGQTYASAKDNARALYADTLAPFLDMVQERVNAFLVPKIVADGRTYVEFNFDAKLQGSFEERATVLQSSVGRPWLTVNEARAMNNLQAVDGGDQLSVPLNVEVGGLASPNDTDPTVERYNAAPAGFIDAGVIYEYPKAAQPSEEKPPMKSRGKPDDLASDQISECLRKFFKRQKRSVLSSIEKEKALDAEAKASGDDFPEWWNADRWNNELAEDLTPLFLAVAKSQGRRTLADIGEDPGDFNDAAIQNYIAAMAAGKAKALNNVTYRQLREALDEEHGEGTEGATPEGVFEKAEDSRADKSGVSFATAVTGWAVLEAVRQQAPNRGAMKTWIVTSGNPRPEHAAMNGETVPYDEAFSNGADWPGDQVLTPEESCNCMCQVEITIP